MTNPLTKWAQTHQREIIAQIREFVECESPSGDAGGLRRFADLVSSALSSYARVRFNGHLTAEIVLPGRK